MISDHKILNIMITTNCDMNKKEKVKKVKVDKEGMLRIIERKMCQENITTFEGLANLLKSAKQECSKEYFLKINPKNHWITPGYLNLMKIRDRKYVRWKQVQNDITKEEFRMAKNAVNDLRRKLKRQNTENRFNQVKGNGKKIWNVLNNLCGRMRKEKDEIEKITEEDGQTVSNKKEIAHSLNKHFSNIGTKLAAKIKRQGNSQMMEEHISESIYLTPTNLSEVKNIVTGLRNGSAPGADGITKNDILDSMHIIGDTLVNLTNEILETGVFPDELKMAKVIPLYKKGPRENMNNYRPISILSCFS